MPGPGACCLLGVCCPPGRQAVELAKLIDAAGSPAAAAAAILAAVDLVPKGLGAAIVDGYRPMLERAAAAGTPDEGA